jgi:hypothetical protein
MSVCRDTCSNGRPCLNGYRCVLETTFWASCFRGCATCRESLSAFDVTLSNAISRCSARPALASKLGCKNAASLRSMLSWSLSFGGIVLVTFSMACYPRLHAALGTLCCARLGMLIGAPGALIIPASSLLAGAASLVGDATCKPPPVERCATP